MQPRMEDVQWLRLVDSAVRGEVPDYSKSRLIAMGLINREGEALVVTEKGKKLLAVNPKKI